MSAKPKKSRQRFKAPADDQKATNGRGKSDRIGKVQPKVKAKKLDKDLHQSEKEENRVKAEKKKTNDMVFWMQVNEAIQKVLRPLTFVPPVKFDSKEYKAHTSKTGECRERKELTLVVKIGPNGEKDKCQRCIFYKYKGSSERKNFVGRIVNILSTAINDGTIKVPDYFEAKQARAADSDATCRRRSQELPASQKLQEAFKRLATKNEQQRKEISAMSTEYKMVDEHEEMEKDVPDSLSSVNESDIATGGSESKGSISSPRERSEKEGSYKKDADPEEGRQTNGTDQI